jgi:uncharacterized protein (DUF934 family)
METRQTISRLLKDNALSPDSWELIKSTGQLDNFESLDGIDLIVPLAFWQTQQQKITIRRGQTAVWLDSNEIPESIAGHLGTLPLVALNFPEFRDGRPYSSARELRQRWGFSGEIRAIGDVLRDQLFYMQRCGFDAFMLREDQDPELALRAFRDFKDAYQPGIDQPLPLFRRR